ALGRVLLGKLDRLLRFEGLSLSQKGSSDQCLCSPCIPELILAQEFFSRCSGVRLSRCQIFLLEECLGQTEPGFGRQAFFARSSSEAQRLLQFRLCRLQLALRYKNVSQT